MKLRVYVVEGAPVAWELTPFLIRQIFAGSATLSRTQLPALDWQFDSEDFDLSEFGFVDYHLADRPPYDRTTQDCEVAMPALVDGKWTQQWNVVTASDEEVARRKADRLTESRAHAEAYALVRLDDFAKTRQYDSADSAIKYVGCSVPKFAAEGAYCRDKLAETWVALDKLLSSDVPPDPKNLDQELPALVWPV